MQQTLEGARFASEIAKRGYAEFDHGIPAEEIELLVDKYTDFTLAHPDPEPATMDAMLPPGEDVESVQDSLDELDYGADNQDQWHKYRTNTPQIGKPDGYTNRSFQQQALLKARGLRLPDEDPKEFYHFTPKNYAAMARNHADFGWGTIPQEVDSLNSAFAAIHGKAANMMLRVIAVIEETHPQIRDILTAQSLGNSPLRLLFYHPTSSRRLGDGHYDKSTLTAGIAESHEGLRVAPDNDSPLELIERDPDRAVVFPGRALDENIPQTPYQPGWHDIINVDTPNQDRFIPIKASEVCGRWALIFFANQANFTNPDKRSTHTR